MPASVAFLRALASAFMPSQPTSSLLSDDALELAAVLEVLADAELSDEDSVLAELELAEELASVELVRPSPRTVAAPKATATMSAMQMVPIAMLRGERFGPTFAWAGLYVELRVGASPTGVPQS
jgi:hypothetical protein